MISITQLLRPEMRKTITLLACLALSVCAMADTRQTVTVGGETVEGVVKSITFDGDDVVLGLDDNTTMTASMADVSISLYYQGVADGINGVAGDSRVPAGVYSISGQYMGNSVEGLPKGVYIMGGKKLVIK